MASKKITFDPTAGVPYAANLTIFGGANFSADFKLPVVRQFFANIYSSSAASIGNFLICAKYVERPPSLDNIGRL